MIPIYYFIIWEPFNFWSCIELYVFWTLSLKGKHLYAFNQVRSILNFGCMQRPFWLYANYTYSFLQVRKKNPLKILEICWQLVRYTLVIYKFHDFLGLYLCLDHINAIKNLQKLWCYRYSTSDHNTPWGWRRQMITGCPNKMLTPFDSKFV